MARNRPVTRGALWKRLAALEDAQGDSVIMGIYLHDDQGRPIAHDFTVSNVNLEHWFKTGRLPDETQFLCILPVPIDDDESGRDWQPIPDNLHPNARRMFDTFYRLGFYLYRDGAVRNAIGAPADVWREDYPIYG